MASAAGRRLATFADLEALGETVHAEIISGEIVEKAAPTMEHGRAQNALGSYVRTRFDRKPGGRWPGGWWIGTEVDVEYAAHELYRHDVVGWRRNRVPTCPTGRPVRTRPDWVCEILLPSNERRDHRHSPEGYVVVLTAASGETAHPPPFEEVELRVGVLFGDEDEDE